jgi:hypothetical protein
VSEYPFSVSPQDPFEFDFLSTSTFQVEVEEALDKVITTLKLFGSFKASFREFRGKLPTYFGEGKKPKTWEFQVETFGRGVQYKNFSLKF